MTTRSARAALAALVTCLVCPLYLACGPAPRPATPREPAAQGRGSARPRLGPRVCPSGDGPPPDCSVLPTDACLGASLARRACESVGPWLDPGAASRFIGCLLDRKDARSACDSGRIVACGFRAAEDACVDGSYRELCRTLATDCADVAPEITAARCEQLLGAFRPVQRPKLVDCLRQGCGTGAFGVCLP